MTKLHNNSMKYKATLLNLTKHTNKQTKKTKKPMTTFYYLRLFFAKFYYMRLDTEILRNIHKYIKHIENMYTINNNP